MQGGAHPELGCPSTGAGVSCFVAELLDVEGGGRGILSANQTEPKTDSVLDVSTLLSLSIQVQTEGNIDDRVRNVAFLDIIYYE